MEAAGLTREDLATSVEIWPEHVQAFYLFRSMRTQWRVGISGATGLDFNVAYRRMDRLSLSQEEYDQLDRDLQEMEVAALAAMSERG